MFEMFGATGGETITTNLMIQQLLHQPRPYLETSLLSCYYNIIYKQIKGVCHYLQKQINLFLGAIQSIVWFLAVFVVFYVFSNGVNMGTLERICCKCGHIGKNVSF